MQATEIHREALKLQSDIVPLLVRMQALHGAAESLAKATPEGTDKRADADGRATMLADAVHNLEEAEDLMAWVDPKSVRRMEREALAASEQKMRAEGRWPLALPVGLDHDAGATSRHGIAPHGRDHYGEAEATLEVGAEARAVFTAKM